MVVNELTCIVRHGAHPHLHNSNPSLLLRSSYSLLFLRESLRGVLLVSPSSARTTSIQGLSLKALHCCRKLCVLCTARAVSQVVAEINTTASGCHSHLCPRADTHAFLKASQHSQEQTVTLNVTFGIAPDRMKREHTPKSSFGWQLAILRRSATGHTSALVLQKSFPLHIHSLLVLLQKSNSI